MLIPARMLSAGSLASAEGSSLFRATENQCEHFWVFGVAGENHAMLLTGDYARHAFLTSTCANWSGVSIGGLELRVDPASANRGNEQTQWQLRLSDDALQVPAIMKDGHFEARRWLSVEAVKTHPQEVIYLSRWSLGIAIDDKWNELFRVDGIDAKVIA